MFWKVILLFSLVTQAEIQAFVFYRVAGNVLRWNVNTSGLPSSVVNPNTKAVRYFIAADAYSETNNVNEINAIHAAFDQWEKTPGANIRFEFAGLLPPADLDTRFDNTNVVFWAKKSLFVAGGTENLNNRRAWTSVNYSLTDGAILDADIVLNGIQYQWYTDFTQTNSPLQYLEATVLHEIGHFLGLDHSPAGGATVRNGATGIASEAGLSADDQAGVRFLNPAPNSTWASIGGIVRMNGSPVFGAMAIVEDAAGNIAGATVTDATGAYLVPSLSPGNYNLRVGPLDSGSGLMRGVEIEASYAQAETAFLPTTNMALNVVANQARVQDIDVTSGEPAVRLLGLSKPTPDINAVTFDRLGIAIRQGQSNYYTGVISRGLKPDSVLTIPGDGLSLGAGIYLANKFGVGLHAMLIPISVSSNATPGLRSFVLSHPSGTAYANGYLEIATAITDVNFDGLDDNFQRTYWPLWTAPESAPGANPDSDQFSNAYEYRTGTNPVDATSGLLEISSATPGQFGTTLSWPADLGRRYLMLASTNLSPIPVWEPIGSSVTATNETMTLVDPLRRAASFYRLQLLP